MISLKNNGLGVGVALTLTSASLTFTATAFGQDPMDPTTDPTEEPSAAAEEDVDTSEQNAEASEPEPVPASVEKSEAPSAAEVSAKVEIGAEAPAEAPPAPATATGTSPEREAAVTLIGLESLPASAYPAEYVRGIKYGSLWRTFHGQQWPYMPQAGANPGFRIGLSGYIWNDLSNARITADKQLAGSNVADLNRWTTQTRGIVRITPTYNAGDGWFVQGNGEAVLSGDMNPDPATKVLATTDDVWVRAGKWGLFDVTVGRFQGWEIANHFGMALDWATLERQGASLPKSPTSPTDGYGLTYFWDRQNFSLGTYAAHFYPTKYLRAELLGHLGSGNSKFADAPYQWDVRPSAIFDIGWLKLKAGWEYGKASPQDRTFKLSESKNGFGFAAQFVLDPYVEFGANFARGFQDVLDAFGDANLEASNTVQSFGGFLNVSPAYEPLVFGFGAFWHHAENMRFDTNKGKVDTNDHQLMFASAQYTVWNSLYLKFVLAHATNKVAEYKTIAGNEFTNSSTSGRLRIEYLY